MPSRAILIIGALGFLCLALVGLLVTQFAEPAGAPSAPTLQASAPGILPEVMPEGEPAAPQSAASQEVPLAAAAEPQAGASSFAAEAQVALLDAYDEPMLAELLAFFDAVHLAVAVDGVHLDAPLHAYFGDLVERLNLEQETYRVTLSAPSLELADERAIGLLALFLDAGLEPGLLNLTGNLGSDGVVVERS